MQPGKSGVYGVDLIEFPALETGWSDVYQEAARQLWEDWQTAETQGVTPPGQVEYIDILRVISTLGPDLDKQMELLSKISLFALKKHPILQG
jgi:hypothetical protein